MTSAIETSNEAWPVAKNKMVTAIVASLLGWSLDLFDLFILLYVAPVVGKLFFPSALPTLSLAAVYASFAVTLLMRPVGSALFGSYGDRYGRRGAMIVAVVGVGIATALFGALPTINQIGIAAPIIFIILRLIQGIFVGGVVASTHTIGTESVPPYWRGAMSGLIGGGGAGLGALVASIAYFIATEAFPGDQFAVWGWRCMFFFGIISSVLGFFIFNKLEESPVWAELQAKGGQVLRAPVRALFSREYLPVLLVNLYDHHRRRRRLLSHLGLSADLPQGREQAAERADLGDPHRRQLRRHHRIGAGGPSLTLWGRKRMFLILAIIRIVLLPFCFIAMARTQDVGMLAFWALVLTFFGNAGYAPIVIFLNERFPTALRATGTGLSWNIGFAIGGMMPTFVSLFSSTPAELPNMLAIFSIGISVLFLAGALIIPETKDNLR